MSTRGKYLSLKLLGSKISSIIKEGNTYHFVLYIALFSILLIRGGNVYSTSGNFKNVLFESSRSSIWGGRQSHVLNSINISNLFSRVNVGSEPLISEDLCIRVNTEIESVCQRSGNKLTITAKSAQTDSLLIACVIIKRGEERILLDAQNFSFSAGKLIIPDLVAGDSVYVDIKDTQGCKVQVATFIPIITPPQLTISATERTCRNDGAINVTVQGGGAPYIFEWSNGATTQNLIGVGAGTYALRVTDKNGCLATASVRIESYEKPTLAFKFNDATCRSPWASAFAIVGGGQGPYTFYWCNGVTTQGNPQIAPGSCAVTVVDARGCQVTDTLVVRNPIPTISLDVSHGTCGRRGAIRANVIGGTGPYVYMWEDEPGLNVSERTIVRPGRYNLQVIDIYGCTASASTTILSSPAIEAFISVEFSNCQKVANLIAIARGGTPPYSYSWSNGVTIAQNENVLPGIYTVRVTDVVGCTYVSSIEVPYRPPLSLDVVTEPATCQKRGKAKAIASGGTGNYRYSWSCAFADPHQSEIDWLPEGRCSVTVYDDAGCSVSESFVISKLQDVRLRLEVVPIFCNLPGTVRAVVEGASSYQINWSNGARGDIIHVFTPGIYTATVTTSEGCYAQASVEVIGSPGPSVVVEKIPPTCFYLGQLRARVRGGRAPYRLEWSNGATTEVVSNLHPGTYTLRVTDANGCVAENQVTLEGSTPLFMRVLTTAATCTSGGSARAVVTGGSGNYRYMWNCILSATNTAFVHNLPVGECSVTVRDDKGCESTQTFAIAAPQSPVVYLPSQVIIGCGRQAYVQAQVTGGEEPYQFIWSNGHQGNILRPLYPGEYTVRVLDKQGCRASATTHVHILTPPLLSIQTQASGCVPSGSAEVSIMQGAAPYRIEWSNGVTTAKNTRLAPGIYRVTVIDANGCRSDTSIIVEKAPDLEVAVKPQAATCLKPGQAEVTVTRGSGSYYYNWHCGSLNPNAPYHYNLPVGECAVTVYDSITGCTATRTFTIAGPTWPQVTFTVTPISCTPGSIQANVSSGTPPYTYWWQNGSTSNSLHNIIVEGNYSLTVIDAKGCSTQATAAIASIPPLQVVVQKKDATCLESGSAKAMVSGGAAPYMYYWSNGAITPEVNNLLPGSYTLTVTDGNHCTTSASFVIEAGRSLDVQIETQNPTTCLGRGGARAIVNGGVEPYTYRWFCSSRISHLNYIDNVAPGYCFVQITDAAGCSITREFIIGAPSGPEVSLHRLDTPCQNEGAVLKAIAQPNGFEPYTYFWSNGVQQPINAGLVPGTYSVTVVDGRGCKTTASTTVFPKPAPLRVDIISEPDNCDASGKARALVSGGLAPYTYLWSNGANTPQISGLSFGRYTLQVRDANGCQVTQEVEIPSNVGTCCPYRLPSEVIPCNAERFCLKLEAYRPLPVGVKRLEVCLKYDETYLEPTGIINSLAGVNAQVKGWENGMIQASIHFNATSSIGGELACIEFKRKLPWVPGSYFEFSACSVQEMYSDSSFRQTCLSSGMLVIGMAAEGCLGNSKMIAVRGIFAQPHLFPNPTTGFTNLQFISREVNRVIVRVVDLYGRSLATHSVDIQDGCNLVELDLRAYPTGIYFVQVLDEKSTNYWWSSKLMKR